MQNHRNGRVLQFGAFELKTDTGEMRKHGTRIRLQGKPLQLLQALLDRPGGVVTREELRDRLWAADTFVDFESGLNTAVNRLRLALGDSADNPRYVETLARNGYRFMAPVSVNEPPAADEEDLPVITLPPVEVAPRRRQSSWGLLAGAALLLLLVAGLALALRQKPAPQPTFHQITFRRITIPSARFSPDGQSVIYEGQEKQGSQELYLVNPVSPESRLLGFRGVGLAAVSRSGELALVTYDSRMRNLVRVPLNGESQLPIDRSIWSADWAPDGSKMAVIRYGPRPETTLEYPRGKVLYDSPSWLSDVRVSSSGREVAFIDHPIMGDDGGNILTIDGQGVRRTLSAGWASADGLAWSPGGSEVWFTAARSGLTRALYAASLSGKVRLIGAFPGTLTLFDISSSGLVLIAREQERAMMTARVDGDPQEKDLSWFDYSNVEDISADGNVILFEETGEGGGAHHSVYIRRAGSPGAVRVGDGFALALSPDANWVVTLPDQDPGSLNLIPLTPGQPRVLAGHGLEYQFARFMPRGDQLLVGGRLSGGPTRLYLQAINGGKPEPVGVNLYLSNPAVSPDGKQVAGVDSDHRLMVLPLGGGEPRVIATGFSGTVLRWSRSGKSLLAQSSGTVPAALLQVDLESGHSKPWKDIAPFHLTGVSLIWPAVLSEDERTIVYSFQQKLSELFVVDGWR